MVLNGAYNQLPFHAPFRAEPRPACGTKYNSSGVALLSHSVPSFVKRLMLAESRTTQGIKEVTFHGCAGTYDFSGQISTLQTRFLHRLPTLETTLRSRQRIPVILWRSPQSHCRDILATSAGTARRGIRRCAKIVSLFTKPGITSPPPLAKDSNASLTTFSGDW